MFCIAAAMGLMSIAMPRTEGNVPHNASLIGLGAALSQPINMVLFGSAVGIFWWIVSILEMRSM